MKVSIFSLKGFIKEANRVISIILLSVFLALTGRWSFVLLDEKYDFANAEAESGRVFIIDAGHGGEDPGAIGVSGVYEKDLNLAIALAVGEELTRRGCTVVYTRTEDKMLYSPEENIKGFRKLSDLKNRCRITEEYEGAYFISIHMNSFGQSRYSGAQIYYTSGNNTSLGLARAIQGRIKLDLQPENDRVVKEGKNVYVLENCSGVGVLIECGFLSNREECERLSQKEYQNQLSFSIVCGILEYIESEENKSKGD